MYHKIIRIFYLSVIYYIAAGQLYAMQVHRSPYPIMAIPITEAECDQLDTTNRFMMRLQSRIIPYSFFIIDNILKRVIFTTPVHCIVLQQKDTLFRHRETGTLYAVSRESKDYYLYPLTEKIDFTTIVEFYIDETYNPHKKKDLCVVS